MQAPHALGDGGGQRADPVGQRGQGASPIALQGRETGAVGSVKRHGFFAVGGYVLTNTVVVPVQRLPIW
ncbi:hypothetical protein [Jannaschia rubra]|uniref:hypothetical protein n=1 Tax=Jannaschia rubra TaxID=282197 RepID=UPI0006E243AC|nr:hypothetical protein [Jannaschia rubra]